MQKLPFHLLFTLHMLRPVAGFHRCEVIMAYVGIFKYGDILNVSLTPEKRF